MVDGRQENDDEALLIDAITRDVGYIDSLTRSRDYRLGKSLLSAPRYFKNLRTRLERGDLSELETPGTLLDTTFGLIADEFTELLFRGVCPTVTMHPFRWRDQLDSIEVLFVESAWLGRDSWWQYAVSAAKRRSPDLLGPLVAECKRRAIPTVFWNKEDPYGFQQFLPATDHFDVVASTEAATESWYKRARPAAKFLCLPFGINPFTHNPLLRTTDRADRVVYAGSWITDQFQARHDAAKMILGVAADEGRLDIYARLDRVFPPPLDQCVRGSLAADQVPVEVARYGASLNVNSIANASTMCSRRVVESLALGVPVISSPSLALSRLFGDACLQTESPRAVRDALEMVTSPAHRGSIGWRAWVTAHSHYRWDDQLRSVLELLGAESNDVAPSVDWPGRDSGSTAPEAEHRWQHSGPVPPDDVQHAAERALPFVGSRSLVIRPAGADETPGVQVRASDTADLSTDAGSVLSPPEVRVDASPTGLTSEYVEMVYLR